MQTTTKELKLKIKDFKSIKKNIEDLKSVMEINKKIVFENALITVCQQYNVDPDLVKSQTRKREIVLPRQIIMYKLHKLGLGYADIGKLFGKDHTTILHSVRKIKEQKDLYDDIIL